MIHKGEMVVFQKDWDDLVHSREELLFAANALLEDLSTGESDDESALLVKQLRDAVKRASRGE